MSDKPSASRSAVTEAERLADDVGRDLIAAARVGWRLANRVGRAGVRWAEKATERLEEAVEPSKRR